MMVIGFEIAITSPQLCFHMHTVAESTQLNNLNVHEYQSDRGPVYLVRGQS